PATHHGVGIMQAPKQRRRFSGLAETRQRFSSRQADVGIGIILLYVLEYRLRSRGTLTQDRQIPRPRRAGRSIRTLQQRRTGGRQRFQAPDLVSEVQAEGGLLCPEGLVHASLTDLVAFAKRSQRGHCGLANGTARRREGLHHLGNGPVAVLGPTAE